LREKCFGFGFGLKLGMFFFQLLDSVLQRMFFPHGGALYGSIKALAGGQQSCHCDCPFPKHFFWTTRSLGFSNFRGALVEKMRFRYYYCEIIIVGIWAAEHFLINALSTLRGIQIVALADDVQVMVIATSVLNMFFPMSA